MMFSTNIYAVIIVLFESTCNINSFADSFHNTDKPSACHEDLLAFIHIYRMNS